MLPEGVEVHFLWFADAHGGGLGCPEGVTLREMPWGWAESPGRADDIGFAVATADYVPGLDLWDCLDDALAEVARAVRRKAPGPVLIVGNSPPRPPEHPHHPFTRLWRSDLPRRRSARGAASMRRWPSWTNTAARS